MMFNQLDYRATSENGLSFELLVDGKLIERLEDADDKSIPYWLFEGAELPSFYNHFRQRVEHVIGVCSCGEAGCGSAGCVLAKDSDVVTFSEVFVDGYTFPTEFGLRFSSKNYDTVMDRIWSEIQEFGDSKNTENDV